MTVLIYVNTSKQVGDPEHIKVFANEDAADTWFEENDPEGVAFEYEILERMRRSSPDDTLRARAALPAAAGSGMSYRRRVESAGDETFLHAMLAPSGRRQARARK